MNLKNLITTLQKRMLRITLAIALILLVAYLFCSKFRLYLSIHQIDPNFIIGFFTVIALLLSLMQSSRDKRYAYNLQIIKSIEDKGLLVIAKLISIKGKSLTYLGTIERIKSLIGTDKIYRDTNEILVKSDIEKDMELVATYIDTFFPALKQHWNDLLDAFSELGTFGTNTYINYIENYHLILDPHFKNEALDNIDSTILQAKILNEKIDAIALEIRNSIVEKINISTGEFRKSFDFNLQ